MVALELDAPSGSDRLTPRNELNLSPTSSMESQRYHSCLFQSFILMQENKGVAAIRVQQTN
jgi:hypothetical protein